MRHEFYYTRLLKHDAQFCSLRCRVTKIGIGTGSFFCQEERVLTSTLRTGASLLWNSAELATFSHATENGKTGMVYR